MPKEELRNLNSKEIFLVRNLFKGYVWNKISKSSRLLLCTLLFNYIKSNDIEIVLIEKTSSGQQGYGCKEIYLKGEKYYP